MNEKRTKKNQKRDVSPALNRADPGFVPAEFRSNLLALVSHELNTPLTGILNAISVLEEKFPDEQDYLPMLRRNGDRLRRTVENMLALAEADAGILRVHLSEAILENLLRSEIARLDPVAKAAGFRFSVTVEADLPSICADSARLRRVVATFLENAVKFSRKPLAGENPEVIVRLEMLPIEEIREQLHSAEISKHTGLFLVVSVASRIPPIVPMPDSFEDFFEPFSPWRDVYNREKEGLGIELALAREILIAHQGFIAALPPQPGAEGCTFQFGLPVLSRADELEFVINNRLVGSLSAMSKVSLLVLRPDPTTLAEIGELRVLEEQVRALLYRSSDSVFGIPAQGEITIIMDDCNAKGAERLAERLVQDLKDRLPRLTFVFGTATGPDHGASAAELLSHARAAWRPI